MFLFIKGLIIGIAKIIPGVSGAMLALSFNLYDKLITSITSFFNNPKENIKFLIPLCSGIIIAIILFSNIISYLLNNYYLPIMLLFIGLILGGTYNFSKQVKPNLKNILIIIITILLLLTITLIKPNQMNQTASHSNLIYFLGGIIEIFSSIIPGISGTAIYMLLGIYDEILILMGSALNLNYVIDNLTNYLSYGLGLFLSFITFSLLISYILKKYRTTFDTITLGLSLSSIILLTIMAFTKTFTILELVIGFILLILGTIISYYFDR